MADDRETLQNSMEPHGSEEQSFNIDEFVAKAYPEGTSLLDEELAIDDEQWLHRRDSSRRVSRSVSIMLDTGDVVEEHENKEIERFTAILRKYFDGVTPAAVYKDLRKRLDTWKSVHINIGVTGASGMGKSTLINTLRRLKPEELGAARVGVKQTTIEPTQYSYAKNPSLRLWDLPGVGTPDFLKENYLSRIEVEKYDSFLIVSSGRFTEYDIWFACELQRAGKHFHFVRTKVDADVRHDREDHPTTHDQEKLLDTIRGECAHHLTKDRFGDVFIALVGKDHEAFDFPKLEEKLIFDVNNFQRESVVYTLQASTEAVIKEKTAMLLRRVEEMVWSVRVIAVLPAFTTLLSARLIYNELKHYKEVYGLNDERLQRLIQDKKVSKEDIDFVVGQHFWVELTFKRVLSAMSDFIRYVPRESREHHPLWKQVVSVFRFAHSFDATPQFLNNNIASMESVALNILNKFVSTAAGR